MRLSRFLSVCALVVGLAAGLVVLGPAAMAGGDSLQDINRLLKQGQRAQALEQVDKYLADKPKDAQGRFLKGLILTEMNRLNDAAAVFQKLTEDYPELPEPYNNLAVIYAQQKQYEKAKQALEMAIRTHPSYATAHENLGDIYSRLASQAYDKALQLDSSNTSAQVKLAMIRNLIGNNVSPAATVKPVELASADSKPPVATPPVKVVEAKPPVATPPQVAEAKPIEPTKPIEAKPVPMAEPAKAVVKAPAANPSADVAKAVEAWAAAWSSRDVKAYLASYAKNFDPPGRMSRVKWEEERTVRVGKPSAIRVAVERLKVTLEGSDKAKAHFRQQYKSGAFNSSTSKTLILVRQDGRWLIQQERVGN
jgi:tetratricopeptide (TPR) repeat protein